MRLKKYEKVYNSTRAAVAPASSAGAAVGGGVDGAREKPKPQLLRAGSSDATGIARGTAGRNGAAFGARGRG